MLDKLRTTMQEPQSRAKRFDGIQRRWPNWRSSEISASSHYSAKCAKLRSVCGSLICQSAESCWVRIMDCFSGPKGTIDQALRKIAPALDAKKRAKYAAVVRLLVAQMPTGGNVKDFVRGKGGINGCVANEKNLRTPGGRRAQSADSSEPRPFPAFW